MKRLLLGLLIVLIFNSSVKAEFWVMGLGAMSCEEVIENMNDENYQFGIKNWLLGFNTGINMIRKAHNGKGSDSSQIYQKVINQCLGFIEFRSKGDLEEESALELNLYFAAYMVYWGLDDQQ